MPVHLSCQQIWAGHFPKGKNMEAVFTAGTPISSQANTAIQFLPHPTWIQLAEMVLSCYVKHAASKSVLLAVSGGGHSWTQGSLLLGFLQGEQHTPIILSISVFSYIPNSCITHGGIPTTAGSNLRSISHCTSQRSFIFTKYKTSLLEHRR